MNANTLIVMTVSKCEKRVKDHDSKLLIEQFPPELAGYRLDKALATMFPEFSRTTIQSWIDSNLVLVNGNLATRRQKINGSERVDITVVKPKSLEWEPQDIPLDVIHEDEHIIVVNKPAGLVVHPGAGRADGTMLNALLNYDANLSQLVRAGIVHRLDKDTSGLLVVARNELARLNLIEQFKKRSVFRKYLAVVEGVPISGGTIDAPVGRHPTKRTLMAAGRGRPAVSHYRIVRRYRRHALLRVKLDTGRTHQIRVHFRYAGFPVLGDPDYGSRPRIPPEADNALITQLKCFRRQALHAEYLQIDHPGSGERNHWHQGLAKDMRELIIALKADSDAASQES